MTPLHKYGVKDFNRDDCEHCGIVYSQSTPIPGREKPLTLKIQCDDCVDAERTIARIHEVMTKTSSKLNTLNPKKDADEIEGFRALIEKQRAQLKVVLDSIRRITKERQPNQMNTGTVSRMPYKE